MIITDPAQATDVDVVVIGSGPGGSVVAATLAEAGKSVLIIEEGQNLPQDSHTPFSLGEMQQKYRNGGMTVAFGNPDVAYAEGSCVGGGSEVNSGLYHRTPETILKEWADVYQLTDADAVEMQRWFDICEAIMQPACYPDQLPPASKVLKDGAEKLGWESSDVPRLVKFSQQRDQQNIPVSHRNSMTETFLPHFYQNNGRLLPGTRVEKLQQNRDSSWTVHCKSNNLRNKVQAKAVYVCAGAVHTPALLRRSGITKNIGDSFVLQPMSKVTAVFDRPVNFAGMGIAAEQVKEFSPGYSFGCSISSRAHTAVNLQATAGGTKLALEQHENILSYYVMARGNTNGSVRNLPGFKSPLVRYNMSQDEFHNLALGTKGLSTIMFESGATRVFTGLQELPELTSADQLAKLPGCLQPESANVMTVHVMGSCPLGENTRLTAANSRGAVHDTRNLYIADASGLCNSLAVNPQGSIMALARRSADYFLNDH